MKNKKNIKYIQLELPLSFKDDQKPSNLISFPHKLVLEKIRKETEAAKQDAIKKGIENYAKSLNWYYK